MPRNETRVVVVSCVKNRRSSSCSSSFYRVIWVAFFNVSRSSNNQESVPWFLSMVLSYRNTKNQAMDDDDDVAPISQVTAAAIKKDESSTKATNTMRRQVDD
jgi:hypothetical protein